MSHARESPLPAKQGAETFSGGTGTSISAATDYYAEATAHVIGAFVAVVETSHGTPRRRVFLTLKAAESSVLRARMAGHRANVVLCNLLPVSGGELL